MAAWVKVETEDTGETLQDLIAEGWDTPAGFWILEDEALALIEAVWDAEGDIGNDSALYRTNHLAKSMVRMLSAKTVTEIQA